MRFGKACSVLLDQVNMTQADLSHRSGLSSSYISQLLSGKVRDTSFEKSCIIADAMGVTLEQIRDVMNSDNED